MQKDQQNNVKLEQMGFKVFRFWDHEVKKELEKCVDQVVSYLKSKNYSF